MIPAILSALAVLCVCAYLFSKWFTQADDHRINKFTRNK